MFAFVSADSTCSDVASVTVPTRSDGVDGLRIFLGSPNTEVAATRGRAVNRASRNAALTLSNSTSVVLFEPAMAMEVTERLELRHLIYPVPAGAGLGIHATLDLAGRVRLGPAQPDLGQANEVAAHVPQSRRFGAEIAGAAA